MEKSLSGTTAIFQLMGLQFFSLDTESLQDGFHQKENISKKHKALFAFSVLILSAEIFGIYYAITLEQSIFQRKNVKTGLTVQFTSYIMLVIVVGVSIVHSFLSTGKAKKIFCNFEKIWKIFNNELRENINYASFSERYKNTFIKISFFLFLFLTILFIFILRLNHSNILLWTVLTMYPYFFMQVVYCRFMFHILFVKENLLRILEVLERLRKQHQSPKTNLLIFDFHVNLSSPSNVPDEVFETLVKLKRIYGILSETTSLINEINGPSFMSQLIVLVVCNISAGFKVYLTYMGDVPVERTGGNRISWSIV